MGLAFQISQANLVNYLMTEDDGSAPRVDRQVLCGFLYALANEYFDGTRDLSISGGGRGENFDAIISSDAQWLADVRRRATLALGELDGQPDSQILSSSQVEAVLASLRGVLSGYSLYALIVQSTFVPEAFSFYQEVALSARHHGLVFLPDAGNALLNVIDPFPALRALADSPVQAPAVLYWTRLGGACALPLAEAKHFYRNVLLDRIGDVKHLDGAIRARAQEQRTMRLLHMSDLHLGDASCDRARRWIKAHLSNVMHNIDRVLVTGDLFHTPNSDLRDEYLDFRGDIERLTKRSLVVVPGNHDVRPLGNRVPGALSTTYELVFDIGWQPLVIDDDLRCVFFCFNSAELGLAARGGVSEGQRLRLASEFDEQRARRARLGQLDLQEYIKIALVHHHPFEYETPASTGYDRLVRWVTNDEDTFMRFEGAQEFVNWCARRGVSLILHGHKHIPHHAHAQVTVDGLGKSLTVIGCGSTTGAEHTAMCYDVVSVDPLTGRWGATFFRDESRDGAGFGVHAVTIDTREGVPIR